MKEQIISQIKGLKNFVIKRSLFIYSNNKVSFILPLIAGGKEGFSFARTGGPVCKSIASI